MLDALKLVLDAQRYSYGEASYNDDAQGFMLDAQTFAVDA
jgi:hypothetical protein